MSVDAQRTARRNESARCWLCVYSPMIDNRYPVSLRVEYIHVETEVIDFRATMDSQPPQTTGKASSTNEEPESCYRTF
jgi:hypothetical protein